MTLLQIQLPQIIFSDQQYYFLLHHVLVTFPSVMQHSLISLHCHCLSVCVSPTLLCCTPFSYHLPIFSDSSWLCNTRTCKYIKRNSGIVERKKYSIQHCSEARIFMILCAGLERFGSVFNDNTFKAP